MKYIPLIIKTIRWPNLAMMAVTLLLVRYCILLPVYTNSGVEFQMPLLDFILLIISTVLIAAGGYFVNDILDAGLDNENKPGRNSIGEELPEKAAWRIYYSLSTAGVALGTLVSFLADKFEMGILFLVIATALYYYSLKYKYLPFWGNFTVALLTGLTVVIAWLFEFFHLRQSPQEFVTISTNFGWTNRLVFGFAFLAFYFSMLREIIKDTQDRIGDARFGCRTLPIILGERKTRWLIMALLVLSVAILSLAHNYLFQSYMLASFALLLEALIAAYAIIRLATARNTPDYRHLSLIAKVILAGGLVSMVFLWFPN